MKKAAFSSTIPSRAISLHGRTSRCSRTATRIPTRPRPPERPMIVKDLLMHTSGLTYGFMHSHPVDAIYRKRRIGDGDLQAWWTRSPRSRCGSPRDQVELQPRHGCLRLPRPASLGHRPRCLRARAHYRTARNGGLRVLGPAGRAGAIRRVLPVPGGRTLRPGRTIRKIRPYLGRPAFLSGGGGMVGTIDDYHRFAKMLLGQGELDGARLLGARLWST